MQNTQLARRTLLGLTAVLALSQAFTQTVSAQAPSDSAITSAVDFKTFSSVPGGEEDKPSIRGRLEWTRARFSDAKPKDYSARVVKELAAQRSKYPELAPGAAGRSGVPTWRSIGPADAKKAQNFYTLKVTDSGRIRNILPHPTDPNTVYILSSGGGIWKTTNFERKNPTWKSVTDQVITTSGGAAAMGRNPNTLYFGTGDPFDGIPLVGGAMLKTTDGGSTWSDFTFLGASGIITDIKVDTSAASDIVLVSTDEGIYRSTDGGNTYAPAYTGLAVWSIVKTSAGWLAAAATSKYFSPAAILRSTDSGATWLPVTAANVTDGAGRFTLAVGAPGDKVAYAYVSTDGGGGQKDLYRSEDGGLTWLALGLATKAPENPTEENMDMDLMHGQSFYNQMIVVDPTDPKRNTVYLGGNLNTAKTTTGGQTWKLLTNWLAQFGQPYAHADHHTAVVSTAGNKTRVMIGTDGGLFVSSDAGQTWDDEKNQGLVNHLIYAIATPGDDKQRVIAGLQDNGTRVRIDETSTFNQTYGGDGFGVGWSQHDGNIALGSYVYGYIYHTNRFPSDQQFWVDPVEDPVNPCLSNGIDRCNAYFYTPVLTPSARADREGLTFFTTTASYIYRTDNGGVNWSPILKGNPARSYIRSGIHTVSVSPTDTNHVAAIGFGGFIWVTADGGKTWAQRNNKVPGYSGFNSNIAWGNNNVLYVASENAFGQAVYVVKSVDGGATWTAAANGLPQVPVSKLLASPADSTGNTVYAATWLGVYRTLDGGASWQQYGAGLPTVNVTDLYMPQDASFLRASTYGRGIWDVSTR
jgi:photosystem II stability/assembly factor-like uncharacterized protein